MNEAKEQSPLGGGLPEDYGTPSVDTSATLGELSAKDQAETPRPIGGGGLGESPIGG